MDYRQSIVILLLSLLDYSHSQTQDCSLMRSLKARKLCREKQEESQYEDDFWSDDTVFPTLTPLAPPPPPAFTPSPIIREGGPMTITVPPSTTPTNLFTENLPDCALFEEADRKEGENCRVIEILVPEIRWRDRVFEKLLPQVWADYQRRAQFERELYGLNLEPVDQIPDQSLNYSSSGYEIAMKFQNIRIHGASTIRLVESLVTRSESLSDLEMKLVFGFDRLVVNGSYSAVGSLGFWFDIDSNGTQAFEIRMENATIAPRFKVDTSDERRFNCGDGGAVLLTDLGVPISSSSMSINFDNIGSIINSISNLIGIYILKTQEDNLIALLKDQIKKEINSLLC